MTEPRIVPCGCKPGSPVTGWHEVRSPECVQAESNQWRESITRFRSSAFYLNLVGRP